MVHETFDAITIHRVPGITVDLEVGADHATVGDGKNVVNIVDANAGIGEDRRVADFFIYFAQRRLVDSLAR